MKRLNSLPERFLRNLTHEFNKNKLLRKQFELFEGRKTFKDFGELNLPPFYGFNSFDTKMTEYELPLGVVKGLSRLGLVDLQANVKRDLIRQLSETFNEPKFVEVLEWKPGGFKCVIDWNIYDSLDLKDLDSCDEKDS